MKFKCPICETVVLDKDLIYDELEEKCFCKECQEYVEMEHICQEEGCLKEVGNGYPTANGYKWRCQEHYKPEEISRILYEDFKKETQYEY